MTARLRELIIDGTLPGGAHLVQSDIAARLRVSVTPVREALVQLAAQGLVDMDPFRGAAVHRVSQAELAEIYDLRRALVPVSVRERLTSITDTELDEAAVILRRMTRGASNAQWVQDNRSLHALLEGTSAMPHLRAFLARLSGLATLYVRLSVIGDPQRRRRSQADHRQLVAAYRRRDERAIVEITVRHFDDTQAVAFKALQARGPARPLAELQDAGLSALAREPFRQRLSGDRRRAR